jgi:futalosine hydrolase
MSRMAEPRTLLLVPTELELARLVELGGFPADSARIELCGFGPVAAAARTAQLVARHSPATVLLVGIAGSYDLGRLPVGSAAAFRETAIEGLGQGFPQWPGIGERVALASGSRAEGLLLTVCKPSHSPAEAATLRARFTGAAAEDMEGFGVALACALAGVPCTIVRGISNACGDRNTRGWRVDEALSAARGLALGQLR